MIYSQVKLIIQNRVEGRVNQTIGRTPTEKMEKLQLIRSSSPYESNRASPTGGRRPLPFKRDLMGLSLSLSSKMGSDRRRWIEVAQDLTKYKACCLT
jgi:hypothetical protein